MLDGIKLRTKFFKEKVHQEEGKEVLKDEDKWFLTAAGFVLATIKLQKFVKFSVYSITYTVAGPCTGIKERGQDQLHHETLEGAISTVEKRLQHMVKLDEIAQM